MTNDLEKLSLGQLVKEIVEVEIGYEKVRDDMEFMSRIELGMSDAPARAKEYKSRLEDLYREVNRRDKEHYSGHGNNGNHDHGGEGG